MRLRNKILLTILAALIYFAVCQIDNSARRVNKKRTNIKPQCQGLKIWYDSYNDLYFSGRLPKDAIIDYGEYNNDDIATTMKMSNGQFHIAFNQNYAASARVAHIFLLHEQCHVQTWGEAEEHGPRWRACMITLDWLGAYKGLLIDGYTEKDTKIRSDLPEASPK